MATETAQTAASTSLTPALFKRLFPRPYLDRFLDENLRPDGRPLDGLDSHVSRDVSVNIGAVLLHSSLSACTRVGVVWSCVDRSSCRLSLDGPVFGPRQARQDFGRMRNHPRDRSSRPRPSEPRLHR